ncbi:MAG: hypothetical protein AB7Y74_02120 [Syntrophorhabdus sp.]
MKCKKIKVKSNKLKARSGNNQFSEVREHQGNLIAAFRLLSICCIKPKPTHCIKVSLLVVIHNDLKTKMLL